MSTSSENEKLFNQLIQELFPVITGTVKIAKVKTQIDSYREYENKVSDLTNVSEKVNRLKQLLPLNKWVKFLYKGKEFGVMSLSQRNPFHVAFLDNLKNVQFDTLIIENWNHKEMLSSEMVTYKIAIKFLWSTRLNRFVVIFSLVWFAFCIYLLMSKLF